MGKGRFLIQVAVATAWVFAVSLIGQSLTDLGSWYQQLRQPEWKPPDWAFGVIWTSIFVLIVIAGVTAWRKTVTATQRTNILLLFAVNSCLHIGWSYLFFTAQRPDWAMIELLFLWASIGLIMLYLWTISRLAAVLLLPYLVWVTIAGFLNYANVELNGPFGQDTQLFKK